MKRRHPQTGDALVSWQTFLAELRTPDFLVYFLSLYRWVVFKLDHVEGTANPLIKKEPFSILWLSYLWLHKSHMFVVYRLLCISIISIGRLLCMLGMLHLEWWKSIRSLNCEKLFKVAMKYELYWQVSLRTMPRFYHSTFH